MKKKIIFLILIFTFNFSYSQNRKIVQDGCLYTSGGYINQKEHLVEFSGPIFNFRNEKHAFGIGPSVQFTYYQKRLYVPYGGIIQYRYKTGDNSGITFDFMYHFRNTFKENLHLLTPQIGICFKHFYIRYGYNIALDKNLYPWTSKNKLSLMYRIKA